MLALFRVENQPKLEKRAKTPNFALFSEKTLQRIKSFQKRAHVYFSLSAPLDLREILREILSKFAFCIFWQKFAIFKYFSGYFARLNVIFAQLTDFFADFGSFCRIFLAILVAKIDFLSPYFTVYLQIWHTFDRICFQPKFQSRISIVVA